MKKVSRNQPIKKQARSNKSGAFIARSRSEQTEILKRGVKDFAKRFEGVMRELANG